MRKDVVTRYVIQTVAACLGLVGLTWFGMGIHFGVLGIRDGDTLRLSVIMPAFMLLGTILVAVGYQTLRHFGANAMKSVTALVFLGLWSLLPMTVLSDEAGQAVNVDLLVLGVYFIPLLLALFLYRAVSRKLIELAGVQDIAQAKGEGVNL